MRGNKHIRVGTININYMYPNFEKRLATLVEDADRHNIDVLFLQEFLHSQNGATKVFEEYPYSYVGDGVINPKRQQQFGNAIYSKYPLRHSRSIQTLTDRTRNQEVPLAYSAINLGDENDTKLYLFSYHGFWGAQNNIQRFKQLSYVAKRAQELYDQNPSSVIILGGDFNDTPQSDPIRYLRGETLYEPRTFWVDASEKHPVVTTRPDTLVGAETATIAGIDDPSLVPPRRTTYLFSYGWVYGRQGYPTNPTLFGVTDETTPISDHCGLFADFTI